MVSIAGGVITLFALGGRVRSGMLVYLVVLVVVLVGWALRVFWTRELQGAAAKRALMWALLGGFTLATLYNLLSPRVGF